MAKKLADIDHVNAAIKRWQSRLQRAMTMLRKFENQRKRIEAAAKKPTRPRAHASIGDPSTLGVAIQESIKDQGIAAKTAVIDTEIPAFLRREKATLDPAATEILKEQEETKRKKARGRIEKMKAKQRGDLKKMPLSGKAALEAIRNG